MPTIPASALHSPTHTDGITRVDLADLIALRARAGKPVQRAASVHTPLAGGHRSALRGRGIDYAESRIYQPGDDVRNIDWRRTARSGKWHTKLFEEEREQSLLVLLDTHTTMRFGTRGRFKSVAAARAAAWLAWTAVRGGDRIGALAFGEVQAAVDPRAGTRGALAVLGALARWDEQGRQLPSASGEALSRALRRARHLLVPGARALLLSDGWCVDEAAETAMVRLARHVDLRVAIVTDALERVRAPAGAYVLETPVGTSRVDLFPARARDQLLELLAEGPRRLAAVCRGAGVRWAALAADSEPDALDRLWRGHGRRR